MLARGQTATAIADSTCYSRYWIGQIAKRYNTEGPAGTRTRQRSTSWRPPRMLTAEQQADLRQARAGPPPEGELWTARAVAAWMSARLGRPVAVQRGWDYLQRLPARTRSATLFSWWPQRIRKRQGPRRNEDESWEMDWP